MEFSQRYFYVHRWLFCVLFFQFSFMSSAQENVGISDVSNTPDPSSVLDIFSTSKGLLIPRMSSIERLAISNPSNSLVVFDTDSSCFVFYRSIENQWYSLCDFSQGETGPPGDDGVHVQDALVDATGDLLVTLTDGTVINAGYVIGQNGLNGIDGADGATGPQGIQGEQGPAGADGADGAQGPQGIKGEQGPAGPSGSGGTKLQYTYNLTAGWNTNQAKLYTVTVSAINGVSPAVGDPVIINSTVNTANKNKFGIAHAWVQSSTEIRFYLRGFDWVGTNNNNTRQVIITVFK